MEVIENDITKVKQKIVGKTIADITIDGPDITLIFTDGSKFIIRAFQYQLLLG